MRFRTSAIGAAFKAVMLATVVSLVVAAGTTAARATAEDDPKPRNSSDPEPWNTVPGWTVAVDKATRIQAAIDNVMHDTGTLSADEMEEVLLAAIQRSSTSTSAPFVAPSLQGADGGRLRDRLGVDDPAAQGFDITIDDPQTMSIALMMVATRFDINTPGRASPTFVAALRAIQQKVLAAAIVDATDKAVKAGGEAASDKAIAAEIASVINLAGVPASLAQSAFTTASAQLSRANSSPAITSAVSSVQAAIEKVDTSSTRLAIQSTSSVGGQSNNALSGSLVNQSNNTGGLGGDTTTSVQTATTVYVG